MRKAFIVEADPTLRMLLADILVHENVEPIDLTLYKEPFEMGGDEEGIWIVDLRRFGIDAYELLAVARRAEIDPSRMILLYSPAEISAVAAAKVWGVRHAVRKPFHIWVFEEAIRGLAAELSRPRFS